MLWMVVPTPMTCLLPHPGLFFLLQQILCSFISNFSLVFSFSFVEGDLHQMVTAWCFSFFVCVFPSFSSSWMFSLSLQLLECLGCLGQCCKGRLSSVHFDDPSSWVVHDPFVLEENLFLTLFITSSLGAAFTNLTMIDRGWGGVKWGGGGVLHIQLRARLHGQSSVSVLCGAASLFPLPHWFYHQLEWFELFFDSTLPHEEKCFC